MSENRMEEVVEKLKLSEVLEKPWTHLIVDFIMKLPVVTLDRRPQFAAELTKELNKMLGIETRLSTAFYPQTDGQTEQMNQELEQYLRFFVDHRQKD